MSLSADQVRQVAHLARLEIKPEQVEHYAAQLSRILDMVSELSKVDTQGVEPMAHALDVANVFAEDVVQPSLPRDQALAREGEALRAVVQLQQRLAEEEWLGWGELHLMVEGASVDKRAHAADAERTIWDTIEFDRAVAAHPQAAAEEQILREGQQVRVRRPAGVPGARPRPGVAKGAESYPDGPNVEASPWELDAARGNPPPKDGSKDR